MAIEQKAPSPKEIKNQPKKFSTEEIKNIKDLQQEISDTTFQLGQINISKMKIESQETQIKQRLLSLEDKERKLAKDLSSKYGKGKLNLDTGEFIPVDNL